VYNKPSFCSKLIGNVVVLILSLLKILILDPSGH
jgi:hypothetical protein